MTLLDKYEGMIQKFISFIFIAVVLFGSVYSPLYLSTAYAGSNTRILINNQDDSNYLDESYYMLYPVNNEVREEANNGTNSSGAILKITDKDLPGADGFNRFVSWLLSGDTYYFMSKYRNGEDIQYTPFFNTPSFQKNIQNSVAPSIRLGGYFGRGYSHYAEHEQSEWTTVANKYGWYFPNYTYLGENPIIVYDLGEALSTVTNDPLQMISFGVKEINESVADAIIGSAIRFVTNDDSFKIDTENGISENWDTVMSAVGNLTYLNEDYDNSSEGRINKIILWFCNNAKNKDFLNFSRVVIGEVDLRAEFLDFINPFKPEEEKIYPETYFTHYINKIYNEYNPNTEEDISDPNTNLFKFKEDILNQFGNQLDSIDEIFSSYEEMLDLGYPIGNVYERYMPYDLESMTEASKNAVGNITDPRYSMWGTTNIMEGVLGSWGMVFKGLLCGLLINLISGVCSLANMFNSMCSFAFLDDSGFDFTMLWQGAIGKILLTAFGIVLILFLIRFIMKYIAGGKSLTQVLIQGFSCVVSMALIGSLLVAPEMTSNAIKDIFGKAMNIGTTEFGESSISGWDELYSNGANSDDKNELKYWLLAYNCWAYYNTNHSGVGEDSAKFDPSKVEEDNAYNGIKESPAKLTNKNSNLWPIVLLEYEFQDDNGIYRVIDHYMSPKFTKQNTEEAIGNGTEYLVASENPIYTGNVQSVLLVQYLFISLAILIMTFIKLLFFIEMIMELALLIIRIMSSAFDGMNGIKQELFKVLKPLGKVILIDIIISSLILLTLKTTASSNAVETTLTIYAIILVGIIVLFIKKMFENPEGFWVPAIAQQSIRVGKRVKGAANGYINAAKADYESGDRKTIAGKVAYDISKDRQRRQEKKLAKQKLKHEQNAEKDNYSNTEGGYND